MNWQEYALDRRSLANKNFALSTVTSEKNFQVLGPGRKSAPEEIATAKEIDAQAETDIAAEAKTSEKMTWAEMAYTFMTVSAFVGIIYLIFFKK